MNRPFLCLDIKHISAWRFVVLSALALSIVTSATGEGFQADDDESLRKEATELFPRLVSGASSAGPQTSPEQILLGRMLFFDPRISADGTLSCMRCHQPALYATDGLTRSIALNNMRLPRNAPTVFNAGLNSTQHWDGRFPSLEDQAKTALLGPGFGNPDFPTAMARLKAIAGYAPLFKKAFPDEPDDPINENSWGKSIAAYERTLVSTSRFDDFLGGKTESLNTSERKGLQTFIKLGCAECHSGRGIGGAGFRKFGVYSDYWKATGSKVIDRGRLEVTKTNADLYKFKVPGLRNVAMTPPYFHDGSVESLPKAVRIMAKVQLDTNLSDPDVDAIVAFLGSLTGSVPDVFEQAPVLPTGGFVQP